MRTSSSMPSPAQSAPGMPRRIGPTGWLVRAGFRALFPRTTSLPGIIDVDADGFIARVQAESPATVWWGLVGSALLFAVTPLFTIGVPLPAFWLGEAALDRHAHKVSKSPVYLVRQAIFLLKMFAGLCWAADDAVRERLAQPAIRRVTPSWRTS